MSTVHPSTVRSSFRCCTLVPQVFAFIWGTKALDIINGDIKKTESRLNNEKCFVLLDSSGEAHTSQHEHLPGYLPATSPRDLEVDLES
ncbi:hypothetical protein AB1N83_010458 [Pleurotus pulmonarius]